MIKILLNPSQIITVDTNGKNYKRGDSLKEINILYDHSIVIENRIIKNIISNSEAEKLKSHAGEVIDLENKIVLPGLVECHTHSAFIGSRANEFKRKTKWKIL